MKELEEKESREELVLAVLWAVADGDLAGGMGASEVMERRASAATIPPIE